MTTELSEKLKDLNVEGTNEDIDNNDEHNWARRVSNAEKEAAAELPEPTTVSNDIDKVEKKPVKASKDPAFIPKTGYYFEHDSREGETKPQAVPDSTNSQNEDLKPTEPLPRKQGRKAPNKKNFKSISVSTDEVDTAERWQHDRFDFDEQQPKSEVEIVKRYGFNIRKAKDVNEVMGNDGDGDSNVHKKFTGKKSQRSKKSQQRTQSSGSYRSSQTPQRQFNNNEQQRNRPNYQQSNAPNNIPKPNTHNKPKQRRNNPKQQSDSLNNSFNYYEKENDYNKVNISSEHWEIDPSKLRRQQPQSKPNLNQQRPPKNYSRSSPEPSTASSSTKHVNNRYPRPYSTTQTYTNQRHRNSNTQERTFNNQQPQQNYKPKHLQLENSITYNESKLISSQELSDHKTRPHNSSYHDVPKRYSSIRTQKSNPSTVQSSQNGYNPSIQSQVYPQPTPFIYQNQNNIPIQQQHIVPQYYYVQTPPHDYSAPPPNEYYNNSIQQQSHVYYNQNQMIMNSNSSQHHRQSKAIPIINPHGY